MKGKIWSTTILFKNPAFGRHWLSWRVRKKALLKEDMKKKYSDPKYILVLLLDASNPERSWSGKQPIRNTSPSWSLYIKTIQHWTRDDPEHVRSVTCPIWNTSPSLRLYAGTIHNGRRGQSRSRLIRNSSNLGHLTNFKALRVDHLKQNAPPYF